MVDRTKQLRQCIAHFETLLQKGASAELAKVYLAQLAAARTKLKEIERGPVRSGRG